MTALGSSNFEQVPLRQIPHGLAKPIATLPLEPSDFSKRFGVRFESSQDDLDELDAALIRSRGGRHYAFVRHKHQPKPGTDILTHELSADFGQDLDDVLRLLQVNPAQLTWIHPSIDATRLCSRFFASAPKQPGPPRVFISYSQHDPVHSRRVRELAQALADDGMDVELDQYHQHESLDWPRWCEERLRPENSDFVLMICTDEYKSRIERRVPADVGRGVFWEGSLIDDYLYEEKANERFIPILLDNQNEEALPRIVRGWTWFKLASFGTASGDVGYTKLYRLLTTQPAVVKPILGETKVLPLEPLSQITSPTTADSKPTNLPYPSLGSLFKGREDFINSIRASFAGNPGRAQAITARHAIHGLGGIGKTRAAVEYAWRFASDYTALLFVPAETPLDFRTNVAALCPVLRIAEGVTDDTRRFEAAIEWLSDSSHHGWLFIVDNLDTLEAAEEAGKALATLHGGHTLITGRLSEWPAFVESRRLDVLDRNAATEFLLARTADKRQPHEDDVSHARSLASELDGLALALEQAAAFIRRHSLSFAEYLNRWRTADRRVRGWHDSRTMQYERPLAATWQTTIDTIPKGSRAMLHILSWLAPEPLPRFLFDHSATPKELRHYFEKQQKPRDILRALSGDADADPEMALATLREFSLLQPAKDVRFANEGQLHRVVALITRERQSPPEQVGALSAALAMVNAAAIGDCDDVRSWVVWDSLQQHVRSLLDFANERGIAEPTMRLMNELAVLLKTKAQHAEAEPLYRRSLAIAEATFGSDAPRVATYKGNLASFLQETNRLAEAEPLMRQALEIGEQSFGPTNPAIAVRLNNLAGLLKATNRVIEAERLFRRALEICEESFGYDHPKVGICLNNLAALLQSTRRLAEAEPLARRALAITEKHFGDKHPTVAIRLSNLALLLEETSRQEEAELLVRRALAIDEESFGPEHPRVAIRLNNLAELLSATNRRSEAESLMQRALTIDEKVLGPEHPAVATRLNNLAIMLIDTNRLTEAEPLMRRHLIIFLKFTRNTGHMHPHLTSAFGNYVILLQRMAFDPRGIAKRLAELGGEAGFDEGAFATLLNRLEAK